MTFGKLSPLKPVSALICSAALIIAVASAPASAQTDTEQAEQDYLDGLRSCQTITDDLERLACFDAAVGNIVTASDAGDVQVVDREDVRQTRRSLFGFNLPDIGLFGGDDDEEEEELFTTTIESVRYTGRNSLRFTTAEGAVWEMRDIPRRLRTVEAGDTAEFKGASFNTFFIRINGQMGVRGQRIR